MRITIKRLIISDLRYCCAWAFFRLYADPSLIAARLGVTDRGVRKARAAAAREGCLGCARCLRKRGVKRLAEADDPPPAAGSPGPKGA